MLDQVSRSEALKAWVRALDAIKIMEEKPDATLSSLFNDLADIYGVNLALIGEHDKLSYRDVAERSNRYAHWALANGLGAGDVVCLLMPNCPDYTAVWLGLTQVGCVVALINTNLVGDALVHCICAVESTTLIVAASLLPSVSAIMARLPVATRYWAHGEGEPVAFSRIDLEIAQYSVAAPEISDARKPVSRDTALLIYTSGTTGLPKAAKVTHGRLVEWSYWFSGMMDVRPNDRMYLCLPMYHSIGGVVAIGSMLVRGGSVLIRERFSASRFWDDVVDGQCTIFQYIGELCRFLVRSEPHPRETEHRLRLCCGNGLRGDVWEGFQRRFYIPRILEFYAATEGNVSLYNCEGKPGAIGRVPPVLAHRFPIALIKCNMDTGEPLRDASGFCINCGVDEPGEAIGKILSTRELPARQFSGYSDSDASARKVLQNVFADGDLWFRTGDLMRKDGAGYYYFIDRLGDTFRWKGENVSTTEVASVIKACPGVTDAVVFGVAVPGNEGRAGMAAITTDDSFSLSALQLHLAANLPEYARPLFIRICRSLAITATFKLKKEKLAHEGFAALAEPDAIWFYDRKGGRFVECDERLRKFIMDGNLGHP